MRRLSLTVLIASAAALAGCQGVAPVRTGKVRPPTTTVQTPAPTTAAPTRSMRSPGLLPGMPPLLAPHDIYAADRPGLLSAAVRGDPALVYVPNSESGTLDVIDQRTFRIVGHYRVGALPQ